MASPDLSRIIHGLPEPVLLVEPQGTVVAANRSASRLFRRPSPELIGQPLTSVVANDYESVTRYVRLCFRNTEGVPGSLRIRVPIDETIVCKVMGGLVHHREGQARLAWLRLLPRESANTRFAAYNERLEALIKESRARLQSEQRWRAAFENSAIGIAMTDLQGRFLLANSVYQEMLGYTEEELQTFSIMDLTYEADRELNWKMVKELLEGNRQRFQIEKRYLRKDGTVIWVRLNASKVPEKGGVPPYLLGVVEDITERRQAEAARRQSEEQYRNVIETATDAVLSIDETCHIVFANPATTKVFGYTFSELIGQPLTTLMPEYMRKLHNAWFRRYVTTGQRDINWQGVELVGLRKNGEEFPVEVSFGEIVKNSHRVFTGFIRDISERKQAEELRTAQSRQEALRAEVSTAFATGDHLRPILQACAEAIVRQVNAAFARIWTLNKEENVLELQASAGMYTQLNGAHSRVPVGALKIGLIAQERKPHLTNDVVNDSRISDKVWAKNEGMVAFAGYPLIVEDRVVGVVALFSRTALTAATLDALASIADSVAQGIERRQSEEALRRSEHYLTEAQKLSHTGSWAWGPSSGGGFASCHYWSKEMFRILEFDPRQGPPTFEMWRQRIHPEDREQINEMIQKALRDKGEFVDDYRILCSDGRLKYIHAIGHPVFNDAGEFAEFVGTSIDLTEQKRTEEALRRSEAYLAEGERLTHTGSWVLNIATREALHSSAEHTRLFGLDPEKGMPSFEEFLQRVHPDDQEQVLETLQTLTRSGGDLDLRYRIAVPGGAVRYMHAIGHPVPKQSSSPGEYVGIAIDITERQRSEQERERLRQLEADLAHINRVSMMGELAASLAHEIKQPIAAATIDAGTCLDWLKRDQPVIDEAREAASRIVQAMTRSSEIINRVRSLFKKGELQREPMDMNEVIREMIGLLCSEAGRHSILIHTELASELPAVTADRVQLQQVLMNLMLNAIDAIKEGGVAGELTIRSRRSRDHQILVSVSDTGTGLPPERADKIFDTFFTTKPQGSGMGLSISRSIVESHGGRLWATANPERGATFQFTLPGEAKAA